MDTLVRSVVEWANAHANLVNLIGLVSGLLGLVLAVVAMSIDARGSRKAERERQAIAAFVGMSQPYNELQAEWGNLSTTKRDILRDLAGVSQGRTLDDLENRFLYAEAVVAELVDMGWVLGTGQPDDPWKVQRDRIWFLRAKLGDEQ